MITFNKLTKAFKKKPPLFTDFSYSFEETGFYKVTGPSGSGKSVLMKLMLGLLKPTSGQILIDKVDITKLRTNHRESFIFNKIYYNPATQLMSSSLTVRENLQLISENPRTIEYLTAFEQESKIDQVYSSLSGGERKIVALIGALIADQETIVLDEPLSSISREYKKIAFDLINEMSLTKLVIMISHDDDIDDSLFKDIIDFNSLKSQEIVNCETIKYAKPQGQTKVKLINSYFIKRLKKCWVQNLLAAFIMIFVSTLFYFSFANVYPTPQDIGVMTSKYLPEDSFYNVVQMRTIADKYDEFMNDKKIHENKICVYNTTNVTDFAVCGDDSKFSKDELVGDNSIAVISNNLDSLPDNSVCAEKRNGSCVGQPLNISALSFYFPAKIIRSIDYEYEDILKTTKNPTPLQKKALEDFTYFHLAYVPESTIFDWFVKKEFKDEPSKKLNEFNVSSFFHLAILFENRDLQYIIDTYSIERIKDSFISISGMDLVSIVSEYSEVIGVLCLTIGIMAYLTYVIVSNIFVKKSLHFDQISFRNHGVKRKSILWTFDLLDFINFAFVYLVSIATILIITPICNVIFSNLAFGNEIYFSFVRFPVTAFIIVSSFLLIFDFGLRALINHHVEYFTRYN